MTACDCDRHHCTECGSHVTDHALSVRDDGVVVAGFYTVANVFVSCADSVLEKLTDELLAYQEERANGG